MFTKQKDEKKLNEISTIVGSGTKVEGNLHVDSSIRIDGEIFGEIDCSGDVTVGKEGYIEHSITCRNLFIAGKVKGEVHVEEKIHIYESGHFEGTAHMNTVVIEENGYFKGQSFMGASESEQQAKKVVELERNDG
ncbi:polymer-forming cytoskeletal protein [Bacillaceae bacterium Marseille-Q3522]|nr:polymer-forming cytoskeletal protein [Bacillaceae bacterium Marseille-Q3522]